MPVSSVPPLVFCPGAYNNLLARVLVFHMPCVLQVLLTLLDEEHLHG